MSGELLLKEWKGVSNTDDCGSYSGVGSSDIFYYCGGNGTSVIVYIATSYELQMPFGMIAQQLVACSS